jgi:hypothetical protein
MHAENDFLSDDTVNIINAYKESHNLELKNFNISYDLSGGYVYIAFEGRGTIENLAVNIMPFFNFCAKLGVYISSCAPYYMSWGDYESGAIFFETDKDSDNNKAIITGISLNGDIVTSRIPWEY